ncbi:MAG: hypothetical protein PHR06_11020 [Candidatus Cloacimonetes bacterium]|nr:hypothetical protein [Candidatus Cloacimonadota bacterium]
MDERLLRIEFQPFDYQYLKSLFNDFRYPRNKISRLIKQGEVIDLKKGLYVLNEKYRCPLSLGAVANNLYTPSYVSLDYALSHYGLIPEHVFNITSVTISKRKQYDTKLGSFVYHSTKVSYYSVGYTTEIEGNTNYLIATPEKALCDKLYFLSPSSNLRELASLLYDDLRIMESDLRNLDLNLIANIAEKAGKKNLTMLHDLMRNL